MVSKLLNEIAMLPFVPGRSPSPRRSAKATTLLLALGLLCSALAARADSVTLLSVTGSSGPAAIFAGGVGDSQQYLGVEFVLGQALQDVSIAAPGIASNHSHPTAWLTNAIGPAAMPSNVIASAPFYSGPLYNPISDPLLTGLDLSPGTYYFLVTVPQGDGLGVWPEIGQPTVSSAPGVALADYLWAGCGCSAAPPGMFNAAFPTASVWNLSSTPFGLSSGGLSLDITADPVPEPGSLMLFGIALLAVLKFKPKKTVA